MGNDSSIYHEFVDTGWYEISLVATSVDGCKDTITKRIYHRLAQTLYIPQSFSPNNDGLNDVFRIVGEGLDPADFEFVLYDRWGRELFRSEDPAFEWDGTNAKTGKMSPLGSYPYTMRYRNGSNEIQVATGFVLIHRSEKQSGL